MTDSEPESYDLTGSDGDEEGKKGRGAPADVIWDQYNKIPDPNNKDKFLAGAKSKRCHRKCKRCPEVIPDATVKQGETHSLQCKPTLLAVPDLASGIISRRALKHPGLLPGCLHTFSGVLCHALLLRLLSQVRTPCTPCRVSCRSSSFGIDLAG